MIKIIKGDILKIDSGKISQKSPQKGQLTTWNRISKRKIPEISSNEPENHLKSSEIEEKEQNHEILNLIF